MNPVANLFVSIGADLSGVTKGLQQSEGLLKSSGASLKKIGDLAGGVLKVGLLGAVTGVAALVGGLGASVKAAMDAETGQAALAAVLASTGGKAGVTAQMANDLASSLQNVTRFEDDTVLAAENMLLTFTNISSSVFPAATETALNMAQAMGTDAVGASVMLGKALNDPTQGMSALTRVGVTFTDKQKEMIKSLQASGDVMGAQRVILKELEVEFGGAARAAGDTFAGKMDILNHKFGDIMETIGGALIPILSTLATVLIDVLNSEFVQNFTKQIGNLFEVLASGDDIASGVWEIFDNLFGPGVAKVAKEFVMLVEGKLVPAVKEFARIAEQSFWKVADEVIQFWNDIQPMLNNFKTWLTTDGIDALNTFFKKVEELDQTKTKWDTTLKEMGDTWSLLFGKNGLIVTDSKFTFPTFTEMLTNALNTAQLITNTRLDFIKVLFAGFNDVIRGNWQKVFMVDIPNILNAGMDVVLSIFGIKGDELRANVQQILQNIFDWLDSQRGRFSEAASNLMQGLIDGFWQNAAAIASALHDIIYGAINNILAGLHLPPLSGLGTGNTELMPSRPSATSAATSLAGATIQVIFNGENAPRDAAQANHSANLFMNALAEKGLA